MADPVNFTRPAAERIARVVRAVEFGNRDGSGQTLDRPWPAGGALKLRLGKPDEATLPDNTAVFTIYSGTTGSESATPFTAKAYVRHAAVHTGAFATIAKVDGDLEVVEGGYALRPARYDASSEWLHDENLSVRFFTGGTVTVTNLVASVPKWADDRNCLVMYEADQYTGEARWGLVSADTYYNRRGTYDATSEWVNGGSAEVELVNGGGTVSAVNFGPSVGLWSGTARDCVVSYEDGQWVLTNAETYYVRRGTYDASAEWANGNSKTVTLTNGGEVSAINHSANVPLWSGTKDCVVSYEHDQWSLVAAETYYVRRGTFSGEWDKNTTKSVTLTDGGTVTADNLFGDVGVSGETRNCAVAYEGGDWFLIAAECP